MEQIQKLINTHKCLFCKQNCNKINLSYDPTYRCTNKQCKIIFTYREYAIPAYVDFKTNNLEFKVIPLYKSVYYKQSDYWTNIEVKDWDKFFQSKDYFLNKVKIYQLFS